MQTPKRRVAALAGAAALSMIATACGGSSSGGGGNGGSNPPPNAAGPGYTFYATNATGTPQSGGVLNVLGTGDVDFMDPNITYYTVGQTMARTYSRDLYNWSGQFGHTTEVVPDLATGLPQVSPDGKTYTVTLRDDAFWNTSPKRLVTGDDFIRGLKISCNPVQPFGGQGDYNFLIVGYEKFCGGYPKNATTAAAIKSYVDGNDISGVSANGQTITIKLTQPASFFVDILALPPFAPRAVEELAYLPGSPQLAQHLVVDGPYMIKSYNPGKTMDMVRNPAWTAASDPIRKAYVNEIKLTETLTSDSIQQQISTNTASADVPFTDQPPVSVLPQLVAQKDPNLNCEASISNTWLVFNTFGALKNVKVRQALSYAINRTHLLQDLGGPQINPPQTHVLPNQLTGAKQFDLYPNSPTKAKALLKSAGVTNLNLTFLYRQGSTSAPKEFQTLQADLKPFGINVKNKVVPDADIYTKYLEVPDTAHRGVWDIAAAGWIPDWFGQAALSFFSPNFDGRVLPPNSSNFGLYNDPATNTLIDQGLKAKTLAEANTAWQAADMQVMKDAPFYPVTNSQQCELHGSQVHNAVYVPATQNFDYTNLWLDPSKNGG
jgi:peptide/nickel transport system substrate-binding protein